MKNDSRLRKYVPSLLLLLLFEAVAATLWFTKDNLFYLLNFSYIGGCMALGTALFTAGKRYARHFVQLAVGVGSDVGRIRTDHSPADKTFFDALPHNFFK